MALIEFWYDLFTTQWGEKLVNYISSWWALFNNVVAAGNPQKHLFVLRAVGMVFPVSERPERPFGVRASICF